MLPDCAGTHLRSWQEWRAKDPDLCARIFGGRARQAGTQIAWNSSIGTVDQFHAAHSCRRFGMMRDQAERKYQVGEIRDVRIRLRSDDVVGFAMVSASSSRLAIKP